MRARIFAILILAAVVSLKADETMTVLKVESEVHTNTSVNNDSDGPVRTDEKIAVLQAGGETYSNVTVTTVSKTDVYFTYAGGMGNVKIKNLSPDLQKHFNFDPEKAHEAEVQLAENKEKYHEELLHQAAVKPPDMTREAAPAPAAQQPQWLGNLNGLLGQAQAENKMVLLDFTGSDWCPWCIKFDQEVLSTPKFAAYSSQKLKFVVVDFPRQKPQSEALKEANTALAKHFRVDSFPTYVLLGPTGRELGRQTGYQAGGPDAFIAELDGFCQR